MIFVTLHRITGFVKADKSKTVPITIAVGHIESVETLGDEISQLTTTSGEKMRMQGTREVIMMDVSIEIERHEFSKAQPYIQAIADAATEISR